MSLILTAAVPHAPAAAGALAAASSKGSSTTSVVLPVVILLALVLFIFLSRRSRRRATVHEAAALSPGDAIVTRAGMLGTLVEVDGDETVVEIGDGIRVRMLTVAVLSRAAVDAQQTAHAAPRTRGTGLFSAAGRSAATAATVPPGSYPDEPASPDQDPPSRGRPAG